MKRTRELYPEEPYGWCDYQPILSEIGNIIIQVDDNDYSGDSRILFERKGEYGFLIFGWGSCSGCDALQSCCSYDELQSLMDEMVKNVRWFDSLESLKKFFTERDWELQHSWNTEETKLFIKQVMEYKP